MARTGRPELEDDQTLLGIATILLHEPDINITEAIRRTVTDFSHEQSEEAAIRRLRGKFKKRREELTELAHSGEMAGPATGSAKSSSTRHSAVPDFQLNVALPKVFVEAIELAQLRAVKFSNELKDAQAVGASVRERMREALSGFEAHLIGERLREAELQFSAWASDGVIEAMENAFRSLPRYDVSQMSERVLPGPRCG